MSDPASQLHPPENLLHLIKKDYEGADSTLCKGCGHDAITASIITACFEANIDPKRVIKLSGIGCSAKTTNYFMNQSFGFNGIHGRMAAMATGTSLANHHLIPIGVSGDGDTASIGLGNFSHMIRRNLRICYLVENNGVYGLTKGQFSATADRGTRLRKGAPNPWEAIDIPTLAIQMGATFVARSFSGDRKQLAPLIEAALNHKGTAILDVLSPCVTFNDHEGSTKSLKNIRANRDSLHDVDFIPVFEEVMADYKEGSEIRVRMHEAGMITLHKLKDHDPHQRHRALELLEEAREHGKFLTGLIYIDEEAPNLAEIENLPDKPLAYLTEEEMRPSQGELDKLNASFML
ncbi:MAG: 2-oxoacid:ferredoxin oxidoreductase subunit beta [bacterium]